LSLWFSALGALVGVGDGGGSCCGLAVRVSVDLEVPAPGGAVGGKGRYEHDDDWER